MTHTVTANSVLELFQRVFEITTSWRTSGTLDDLIWYRGVKNCERKLMPGAYRKPGFDEYDAYLTFYQEGAAYPELRGTTGWDAYYVAQHYGLPTRMLDWTTSLSAAAFFALDRWDGECDPCIWMLQPYSFNEASIGWNGLVAPMDDGFGGMWLPLNLRTKTSHTEEDGSTYRNENPIAIYPKQSNVRIVAQQGTFTVHGSNPHDLEEVLKLSTTERTDILAKVVLRGVDPVEAKSQLWALGISRRTMFPDLPSFVEDLKERYGW